MSDFVKKKIVEKLARFTKNLKPSDISFKFLTGKGSLNNLELNAQFLTEILQLPPWIQISRVVCDSIKAHVPFMKLGTDPIKFSIGLVVINVSTCVDEGPRKKHTDLLDKIGSNNPSSYGFTEKVIDGMRVEIRSILVHFTDPTFTANLEMTDILIQSTTPDWQPAELPSTRRKIADEDSVVTFKMCSWSGVKIEGWSTTPTTTSSSSSGGRNKAASSTSEVLSGAVLRMIANETKIRIAFKRNMSDSSLMCTRVSVHLGDVIWILTQSQLRALSRLVQTLMDAAVKSAQRMREEREKGSEGSTSSLESLASVSGDTPFSHKLSSSHSGSKQQAKKNRKTSSKKHSQAQSANEKMVKQRISDYRDGKLNIPRYEVIQNSFHLRSGKIDLQLCNDVIKEDGSSKVQGSMLIQLTELVVDVYLDQPAGVGRAQWNMANDLTTKNRDWSRKLIERASKTQYVDLPSVNPSELRERGVVIRCANFSVDALRSEESEKSRSHGKSGPKLPIITSDKKTFNIPDDVYNPAFQISMTLYHYPDKCGTKFLLPRPNIFIYFSPIHINVHQESCLWLVEYVNGVIQTVNLELAVSVKDEGKAFIEEHKAKSVQVPQVPGIDFKVKVLFTKITLPVPEEMSGKGRPKALQVETSAITAKNRTLDTLLTNDHFTKAMKSLDQGWVFDSQETGQFPHYSNDLRSLPTHLRRLLNHKPRSRGRSSTLKDSNSSSSSSSSHGGEREREREKERENRLPCGSATNPEDRGLKTELNRTEGYHIHTSCVQLAFVDSYTHQATLRTTSFVDDFPIHVWVFIPPSLLDKSLANQEPALSSVPGATPTMGGAHNEKVHDAMISFIAHAPQPIKAKLERLQLLFIMRLKDSFTDFKNSLMKFLVLPSSNNKSATKGEGEKEREEKKSREGQFDEKVLVSHDAEHLQLLDSISTGTAQARSSSATSLNVNVQQHNMRSASQGGPIPIPDVKTTTTRDGKGSTSTTSDKLSVARASTPSSMLSSGSSESDVSATISGCVVVESVEACIILPSILKAHGMTPSRSGTPIGGNALSPMSPSTPLAGSSSAPGGNNKKFPSVAEAAKRVENAVRVVPKNEVQGSENGVLESKSENPELMWVVAQGDTSLFEGGVEDHFSERAQVSTLPRPSPGSQTTSGSATSSPGVSPAQSQLSLSSQVSQSSQFSQSSQISQSSQFSHSSQINQSSQISQSSQFSLSLSNMSSTHSPSITSLPTLIESGNNRDGPSQSFNYPRGTPTTAGSRGHAPAVPSSLNIRPPMRSLSASHLPPSSSSARPGGSTTAPSQFHPHHPPNTTTSTLVPHSRNSTSTLVHGRNLTPSFQGRQSPVAAGFVHENSPRTGSDTANYVTAAGASSQGVGGGGGERGERGTQSERTSPVVHVTAIGGTGTVIETQYESKALWSESPHEESDFIVVERPEDTATGVARRGVSDRPPEQGVMAEASSLESIPKQRLIESSEDPLPLSSSSTTTPSGYHTGPAETPSSSSLARQLSSKSSSLSAASLLNPPKQQLLSSSSRRSSQSSLSSRRLKVQSPPKMEPQYNLVIKVGGICALPNIQAKEISVRASVNNVKLEEVEISADSASGNNSQRQTPRHQKIAKNESTEVILPKVKARIILGDKVKELFPEDASNLDIVLIGKANDLDVSLLLPNALVMKDFFDDEYEADNPVPMHLRIENTRVVLMEEAGHGPDHVKTMRIAVDRTDIHRGRRLREGVDVFLERGRELMGRAVSTETLHDGDSREEAALGEGEDEMALVGDGGGVAGRIDVQLSQQGQVELTESFNSFLRELEHYLSRDGRQNSREQVVRVLEQIRTRSLEASVEKDSQTTTGRNTAGTGSTTRPRSNDATTPTHFDFDTVSTFFASYHQSKLSSSPPSTPPLSSSPLSQASHPLSSSSLAAMATSNHEELLHLRRENERLRQQEAEYQKENAQLLESKENMVKQLSDFDMVTEECMSVKEQLVAYKQVMEKQHEQMEKLLNENTELQRKLAVGARSS